MNISKYLRLGAVLMLVSVLLGGCAREDSVKEFKVIGYMPNWYGIQVLESMPIEKYTHINYAFAIPTKDGEVMELPSPGFASRLIEIAHVHGVKVLISLGGWSYNGIELEPTFVSATETPEKCALLARNIVEIAVKYGFDGVDLDWEHPKESTAEQFEAMVLALREECTKAGLYLTAAVVGGDGMTTGITDKAAAAFDWINVMCYDGGQGADHSPMSLAEDYILYWTKDRQVDPSKVTLGVPFYERPTWSAYSSLVAADPGNAHRDETEFQGKTVYYNGIETMKAKAAFAMENAGGIMIWQITQDAVDEDLSLLNAILEMIGGEK